MPFKVEGVVWDEGELPEQFHDLIPLISKWVIGDDVMRSEKQQDASAEELYDLVERVAPRLEEINEFLGSFSKDSPKAACLLGGLAECTVEVQMELGLREEAEHFPDDSEDR